MKETLLFYTTLGCHLCDQAKAVFETTLNPDFFTVKTIDIAESDQLIEQYGTRIPVIKRVQNETELNWPFDSNQLIVFLSD